MRKLRASLLPYHNLVMALFILSLAFTCTVMIVGCAGLPQWLADSSTVLETVSASITAVLGLIGALTGNAALAAAALAIQSWVTKITTGIADVETLVKQYQADESATLLGDIEAALTVVEADVSTDFSNLGLPASFLSVIQQIAALALSQLQAWASLIPALKSSAMTTLTLKVPYSKKEYAAAFNKILDTPTGDPAVDVALAKIKRL